MCIRASLAPFMPLVFDTIMHCLFYSLFAILLANSKEHSTLVVITPALWTIHPHNYAFCLPVRIKIFFSNKFSQGSGRGIIEGHGPSSIELVASQLHLEHYLQ